MAKDIKQVKIADASDTSEVVNFGDKKFCSLIPDANFGGTSLTIKAVDSKGTVKTTNTHDGTTAAAITLAVSAGTCYVPVGDIATGLAALSDFVFVSDSTQSGADCYIECEFKV